MVRDKNISLFASLILLLILSLPCNVYADDPEIISQEIYHSLMSPYCPGKLLSDCPSGAASELKQKIKSDLVSGKSKDSVIKDLYLQYGEDKLKATPDTKGWGLVGWLIPSFFLLSGALTIGLWLRSSGKVEEIPSSIPDISKELSDRIKSDMR